MGIKQNLAKIKEQIGNNSVKIIAVTKYATEEQISEAYKLGIRDFGESYFQDALEKISQRQQEEKVESQIQWHFIGRLQKNKAKHVVGKFALIHSVDSVELAELISKTAFNKGLVQDILLQVNISQEPTKGGFKPEELNEHFAKLIKLPNVKTLGFMTIAPKTEDKALIKNCFLKLRGLKEELSKAHMVNLKELSMGMTNDYVIAIDCGATMIRIGRGLFDQN